MGFIAIPMAIFIVVVMLIGVLIEHIKERKS